MEIEKARILDFYLAFPTALLDMRLPQDKSGIRQLARDLRSPYRSPVNAKRAFGDMQQVQLAAINALAASGFLEADALKQGIVNRASKPTPEAMKQMFGEFLERDKSFGIAVIDALCALPTYGVGGLKERSGLLEYRYDVT